MELNRNKYLFLFEDHSVRTMMGDISWKISTISSSTTLWLKIDTIREAIKPVPT